MLIIHTVAFQAKENPTLKDNDFLGTGERIIIGEKRTAFIKKLTADIQVKFTVIHSGAVVVFTENKC